MKIWDFHRTSTSVLSLTAAVLLLAASAVHADENEEVAKLYKQGNLVKALEQADAYLASKPRDAQMRFNKGLILTEQKKVADAIKIFSSLSDDYPDLPEPYNNLAVLYASQGQYEKARDALEAAIRTHPSYSTAHENLGDIYAKMASQAYGKALQLDKGNAAAQTKLAMIKDLFTGRPRVQTAATAVPSSPASESAIAPPEKNQGKPEAKSAAKAEKPPSEKSEKVAAAEKPAQERPPVSDDSGEIIRTLIAWAKAWSDKDTAAYLAFYANDFRAPGGASRTMWEKARRDRITKPKSIHVVITNPKVSFVDANHARVSFKQSYHSDAIKSHTGKTLEMVKSGEKWLIHQEQVGR
ncbi:nuclear transport factor 2 family protein [Nitrosovibrio tenuis]|uniref:Tetratricopeptide repeat-containing protein n=1 Tax=Nitrosovibrio tenuis TaxID=1233 RepID=A0A1H7MPP4_9PROT|nr:nuclear transport factor 2 family protein [Nitrosovibrio tenuis]SEL12808.1 Tetratricopeptide repeat-containing protein [Nitrosovibrio tenuis]